MYLHIHSQYFNLKNLTYFELNEYHIKLQFSEFSAFIYPDNLLAKLTPYHVARAINRLTNGAYYEMPDFINALTDEIRNA